MNVFNFIFVLFSIKLYSLKSLEFAFYNEKNDAKSILNILCLLDFKFALIHSAKYSSISYTLILKFVKLKLEIFNIFSLVKMFSYRDLNDTYTMVFQTSSK